MKPTAKLLSLTPVLALSVACGGMSPTAPDASIATDTASSFARSEPTKGISPRLCAWISGVDLQIVPATNLASGVVVGATYRGSSPGSDERCPAPKWSSKPEGAIKPIGDGFSALVDVTRTKGTMLVMATAPNGAVGMLEIPSTTRTSVPPVKCAVSAVELQVLPILSRSSIIVEATYRMIGPNTSRCDAPEWGSSAKGILVPQKNPFRIGVDLSQAELDKAEVWATAPNGVTGTIVVVRP